MKGPHRWRSPEARWRWSCCRSRARRRKKIGNQGAQPQSGLEWGWVQPEEIGQSAGIICHNSGGPAYLSHYSQNHSRGARTISTLVVAEPPQY